MKLEAVTANRLVDGAVVYLTREGYWSELIIDSRTATDADESAALLTEAERAVEQRVVVNPYLISIADDGGVIEPLRFRELIRARGPTAGLDAAKRAGD